MKYEDLYNPKKPLLEEKQQSEKAVQQPPPPPQNQASTLQEIIGNLQTAMPKLVNAQTTQTQTQTGNQTQVVGQGEQGGQTNQGFYSPELEKLKHAFLTQDWFSGSPYKSLFEGIMNQLAQPINLPVGLTAEEQQELINRARANIAGQTQSQLATLANLAGGRGFRFGESGRLDTAAAQIFRGGQQQLGEAISNLMIDEARRRFEQNLAAQQFNLARLTSIPQFAQLLEGADINRLRLGLEALQTGGGLEQFMRQLQAQEAAASAANALRQQQFEYQQQMDALKLLFGLYQGEMESQQNIYNPWWRAILGGL